MRLLVALLPRHRRSNACVDLQCWCGGCWLWCPSRSVRKDLLAVEFGEDTDFPHGIVCCTREDGAGQAGHQVVTHAPVGPQQVALHIADCVCLRVGILAIRA
jgi:hypothetical protein